MSQTNTSDGDWIKVKKNKPATGGGGAGGAGGAGGRGGGRGGGGGSSFNNRRNNRNRPEDRSRDRTGRDNGRYNKGHWGNDGLAPPKDFQNSYGGRGRGRDDRRDHYGGGRDQGRGDGRDGRVDRRDNYGGGRGRDGRDGRGGRGGGGRGNGGYGRSSMPMPAVTPINSQEPPPRTPEASDFPDLEVKKDTGVDLPKPKVGVWNSSIVDKLKEHSAEEQATTQKTETGPKSTKAKYTSLEVKMANLVPTSKGGIPFRKKQDDFKDLETPYDNDDRHEELYTSDTVDDDYDPWNPDDLDEY